MLNLQFTHGLGDCVNFAHVLELYRRRGLALAFQSDHNKQPLIDLLGFSSTNDGSCDDLVRVPWHEAPASDARRIHLFGANNKAANNISRWPLPNIGTPEELWDELLAVRFDVRSKIPQSAWDDVRSLLRDLPRPIVLLHTMGNTTAELKNLAPALTVQLYHQLLDRLDGSLILLDWDNRVPRLASYRVRHMSDDWQRADIPTLLALLFESALLVAIDSGPLHLSRLTDIPAVAREA